MRTKKQYLLRLAVTFSAYYAAAWATRRMPFVDPDSFPIWFPTGVALFLGLMWGPRIWPAVVAAGLLFEREHSWPVVLADCLNTIEPMLGAHIIRRLRKSDKLTSAWDLLTMLGVGAVGMPVIFGAVWGISRHLTTADWILWVAGDLNGVLLVTPLLLSLRAPDLPSSFTHKIEALCATGGLATTVFLVFGMYPRGSLVTDGLALSFLVFPFMVWIGFRCGLFWTSATVAGTAFIAISQTGLGRGPFYHTSLDESVIWLHIFVTTVGVTSLILAAIASEKACTAAKLRASEASVRNIFAQSPIGIFQSTVDGKFMSVNPAMAHIFGFTSPEEMVAKVDCIPEQLFVDSELRAGIIESVLAAEEYIRREVVYRRKDGSHLVANLHMRAVRSAENTVQYVEGFIEEITERKLLEEKRLASERRFRELLQCIRLLAVILDLNGTITFCNEYSLASTGWRHDDLVGHSFLDFVPADSRGMMKEILEESLQGRLRSYLEVAILTKSGSERWIQWDTSPLHDESGALVGFACVGRDVTDHRELQQQFQQAQKMDAIGRLAGGVAHDINNVLQAVILPAEMMLLSESRRGIRAKLDGIVEVAKRGASVAQQLLAFSRRQVVKPRVIDVHESISEMQKMFRQLIREDIDVVFRLEAPEARVLIDPGQLVQVILNLVVNAQDAIPNAGRVEVRTANVRGNCDTLVHKPEVEPELLEISVSDTGCGMTAEVRQRAFEPFFTTKEFGRGTGLGLSTVYGIVQQCGGFVDIITAPEMGTKVQMYLPLIDSDFKHIGGSRAVAGEPHVEPRSYTSSSVE